MANNLSNKLSAPLLNSLCLTPQWCRRRSTSNSRLE